MSPASSHLIVTFCPRLRNCPGLQPVVDSQEGPSAPLGPWWSPRNPPPHPRPVRAPGTLWVSAWIVRPSRGPARGPGAAGPPAPAAILRSQGLPPSPNSLVDLNALAGVGGDVVRGAGPLVDLNAYVVRMHTLLDNPALGSAVPYPALELALELLGRTLPRPTSQRGQGLGAAPGHV